MNRNQEIIRTSVLGIIVNSMLAGFKVVVGFLSGSIAIILDAFSSIITIISTKLASKKPDHKHPYGYGRVEYLSALVISLIIIYAGITSFVEAIKSIFNPSIPTYTTVGLVIIFVAVLAKFSMGMYVKKTGERLNSGSLIASGEDSRMDSIIPQVRLWLHYCLSGRISILVLILRL